MINVTKTYLPPFEEYQALLKEVWESGWVTNYGPLSLRLEDELKRYLDAKYLRFVNNGTIALQIAIRALDLKGEVITTPFSYVATTSSIVWESCTPVFADIEPDTLTLSPESIKKAITSKTQAILATHVYGNPCDVYSIENIAREFGLKVIYDGAHSFGVRYKGVPLLNFGDISTLSFHATKLFHTGEGGAILTQDSSLDYKISYMMNFGHSGPETFVGPGINGKNSELHAAMGLCVLPKVNTLISKRKNISELYDSILLGNHSKITRPKIRPDTEYNFSYYPVLFESEDILLKVKSSLNERGINPRRYFYPSLSHLNYVRPSLTPVSDSISKRVLCLPLFYELELKQVENIAQMILKIVSS